MRLENAVAADVLERILSAYGFTMQKELSDKLGIAKSNVASWLQRRQVPGNVLVQCALDTGADVRWLVTGKFANANNQDVPVTRNERSHSGAALIKMMLSTGGKPVLKRIMEAYKFSTQKELSDYLGISTGTISTWVRREYFPGDLVIACAIDTNVSLVWLATGRNESHLRLQSEPSTLRSIKRKKISSGIIEDDGLWFGELTLFNFEFDKPLIITSMKNVYFLEERFNTLSNGCWLLSIDNKCDIYNVSILPKSQIEVKTKVSSFICQINDVTPIGRVIFSMKNEVGF